MKNFLLYIFLISVLSGSSLAQTTMTGEIGLDLESFIFDKAVIDTSVNFAVNRSLSNHFLDLRLAGPLISDNFATYMGRSLVYGTYSRVTTNSGKVGTYIKPNLRTYNTALTLFPKRAFPLFLYLSKTVDHTLRYEPNNRTAAEDIQPELAVVRRYQTELRSRGGRWNAAMSEKLNLTTEYKQDGMKIARNYDFNENRNIWVAVTSLLADPTVPTHSVEIRNKIPDDTVIVYIDNLYLDSIASGATVTATVDSGSHTVDFIPLRHNSYSVAVQINGNMIWEILYNPPATPNDLDQTTTSATGILRADDIANLTNETYYNYNDIREKNQKLTTYIGNLSNTATYALSPSANLQLLTAYNRNRTTIDTISSQLAKSFMHQTTLGIGSARSFLTSIMHSFSRLSSEIGASRLLSNTHTFANKNRIPLDWHNYEITVNNTASLVSDISGYKSDQYGTDIINGFAFRIWKISLQPKNQTKFSYNVQENPGQKSNELENKTTLGGDVARLSALGKLRFRSEFDWRRKRNDSGDDIRKKYTLDLTLERSFLKNYKVSIATIQDKETYGGTLPSPGANPNQLNPARQAQITHSYKASVQVNPLEELFFNGGFMLITQNSARIEKLDLSLVVTVPGIHIPVKSFLSSQTRKLSGLPPQTQLTIETKLSYRFRQIALVLSHSYNREKLVNEKFVYQEILGKISRQFTVF